MLCCQKCFQVCSNQILQLSKNALEKCHTKTVTVFLWGLWPKINSVFFFLFKLYWPGHLSTANCLRCGSRDVYILTLKTWVGESCREKIRIGTTFKQLQLAKYSMLLYRYWWNTRIMSFTKKSYLHRTQWRYYFRLSRVMILVSPWFLTWLANYKRAPQSGAIIPISSWKLIQ